MNNLKCLFIRNNYLTTLNGIGCLSQLVILDVSNNELKEINEIGKLTTQIQIKKLLLRIQR